MMMERIPHTLLLQITLLVVVVSSIICVSAFTTPHRSRQQSVLQNMLPINNQIISLRPPSCVMATIPRSEEAVATLSTTAPSSSSSGSGGKRNSKLRQLKDRMWVREALEDITAAEFASSLSLEDKEDETEKKKKKRAVDFDNLLNKLDVRIEEMCVVASEDIANEMNQTCHVLDRPVLGDEDNVNTMEKLCYSLSDNIGMGSVVYTHEQREALLKRLISTRERLVEIKQKRKEGVNGLGDISSGDNIEEDIEDIRSQLQTEDIPSTEEDVSGKAGSEKSGKEFDPSLYVRDDGTVDWDGALQDREALKKFGSAVWSRINGQEPSVNGDDDDDSSSESEDFHTPLKAVTAKIADTDAIREKRAQLDDLVNELYQMDKEHTKLLNSAISAGQPLANVNLATINNSLRQQIRKSSDELEAKTAQVTFQNLNYELERIYTYLEGELGNTAAKGYIPLQDRLNVAEFGMLESQLDNFNYQIELSEILDSDVLAVVADQVVDFKRRLGIDYYVTGLTFDSEAIQMWLGDIWVKTKNGFAFYVKGTRLFIDDVVFCTSLILRALQGYTLKPREVRTLRRTFKDTITFIPVVIILIIPLTPIGHVIVFGAIQRVYPDFFPSCFTERRQNLLELYESTEYSAVVINETWQVSCLIIDASYSVLLPNQSNIFYFIQFLFYPPTAKTD